MESPSPASLPRHELRQQLRRFRTDARLSQDQVAEELGWSRSKVLRIESGQVGLSRTDLKALLELFEITDPQEVERLRDLATRSRHHFWGRYRDVLKPEYLVYLEYESSATHLRTFHPLVIPGPLQTRRYAESLIRATAPGTPQHVVERQVEVRLRRRAILERNGAQLQFVIDEAAIRRQVGNAGNIMEEQLQQIKEIASQSSVSVGVLPFSFGFRVGTMRPLVLLDLPGGERILYWEGVYGRSSLESDSERVALYADEFEQMKKAASLEVLDRVLRGMVS